MDGILTACVGFCLLSRRNPWCQWGRAQQRRLCFLTSYCEYFLGLRVVGGWGGGQKPWKEHRRQEQTTKSMSSSQQLNCGLLTPLPLLVILGTFSHL